MGRSQSPNRSKLPTGPDSQLVKTPNRFNTQVYRQISQPDKSPNCKAPNQAKLPTEHLYRKYAVQNVILCSIIKKYYFFSLCCISHWSFYCLCGWCTCACMDQRNQPPVCCVSKVQGFGLTY